MTRYSVDSWDQLFGNRHGFLSFTTNMGRDVNKNISKLLSAKYSQNCQDHATDELKTISKKLIQKRVEETGNLNKK